MRLVIQRVSQAHVKVVESGVKVGKIQKGLLILIGIKKGDTERIVEGLVDKVAKLRIMSDENDKMNLSVLDAQAEVLAVSQFTLYANTTKGNRPSFLEAEDPAKAQELYQYFVTGLKEKGITVATGSFGEYMEIEASLDGPVTITLES